jgi:hypothetical protein
MESCKSKSASVPKSGKENSNDFGARPKLELKKSVESGKLTVRL